MKAIPELMPPPPVPIGRRVIIVEKRTPNRIQKMIALSLTFVLILVTMVHAVEPRLEFNERTVATGWLFTAVTAAHLATPDNYDASRHTLSALAAQNYHQAWIMRTGLIGFGTFISAGALRTGLAGGVRLTYDIPLLIYGLAMVGSGLYSHEPFEMGVPFDRRENELHSIAATTAGVALSTSMLMATIFDEKNRWAHGIALGYVTAMSAIFGLFPDQQGIWQRLLWVGGLTWLALFYPGQDKNSRYATSPFTYRF